MITGLFETHVAVSSLTRSMAFYEDVLGLERAMLEPARKVAFYWIGSRGEAMLGLWERTNVVPQHFAFRASVDDILNRSVDFLRARGLTPYNFLRDGREAPMVFAWMPAVAIYFKDPDGHELEFIAMLKGKPDADAGIVTYPAWLAMQNRKS